MSTRRPGVGEAPSLVSIIWRRRWVLLVCAVVGGVLGYGLSSLQPASYTATSVTYLSADGPYEPIPTGQGNGGDPSRFLTGQASQMELSALLKQTITKLNLDMTVPELKQALTISGATDADIITVTAKADSPQLAAQIADAVPAAYRSYVTAAVDAAAKRAIAQATVAATITDIRSSAASYGDGVSVVNAAEEPLGPSSPQPLRDGLLLGLLALLVAAAASVFRQQQLTQWASPTEAATLLDSPLLAVVPSQGLRAGTELAAADSPARHAYRMAAITLDYIRGPAPWSAFFTGARAGVGTTTTALNIASAVADQGLRVIVIDIDEEGGNQADPYRPRVSLDHLAGGHVNMASAVERHPGTGAEFGIVRARIAPYSDGQHAVDMRAILERLPDGTDMVIIDGPPLLSSADSFAAAGQVDAVVVVTDNRTSIDLLDEVQARCDLTGVRIGGVVVNELRGRRSGVRGGKAPAKRVPTPPTGLSGPGPSLIPQGGNPQLNITGPGQDRFPAPSRIGDAGH